MEINNLLGNITANTDKVGLVLGFMTGSPGGFDDVNRIIENIGNIHMPNFITAIQSYLKEDAFKTAAFAYLAGMVIDEVNPPFIGKYGNAIKKFGVGYGAGALVQKIVYHATAAT